MVAEGESDWTYEKRGRNSEIMRKSTFRGVELAPSLPEAWDQSGWRFRDAKHDALCISRLFWG